MISRDPGSLGIVQNRSRACFVDDVVLGILQIRPFLLPEEIDVEAWQQWCELVCDVLEDFGAFF